jgi:cytochrome c oxidase cbb3-type subunit 3
MSRDRDQLMGHASDNDGIEEYDNPLPDWWVGMFIFTILFAAAYPIWYHFDGWGQEAAYLAQMEDAKQRWPQSENAAVVSTDPADIAAGEAIYQQNCAACHKADLTGAIGPSLVDKVWVHDGTAEGIIATVTNGVAEKGMPGWGPILGPDKVGKVSSFIVSKGGALAPGEASAAPPDGAAGTADAPGDGGAGAAEVVVASIDPADITPDMLASGEEVFTVNCVACHKADMTGLIGPNLIDAEWIHGGELSDITRTVTVGVPEKGMVPWGPVLGEEKIRDVSAYVYKKSRPE